MGDELTLLMEVFHKIEKAGGQATLSVSTAGGKTKVKLEVATTPAPPTVSPTTSSSPGRRHRRRGARARARRNQRAAAHQASLVEAVTIALCRYPHVNVSIRDLSRILTTAPIFLYFNYFRQKYLEIASCAVSLLNSIWVQVEHSLLQQPN